MTMEQPRRNLWWIVPVVVVVLALVAWLLFSRSPSEREVPVVETATMETIAEGTVNTPSETGTIVELTDTTATTATTVTQPPPAIIEEQPPIVPDVEPLPPQPVREITDSEATSVLRAHLGANNPYDAILGCLQIRDAGYSNAGFAFTVWDSCVPDGGTRLLGRWRVDAVTKEVFRQRDDGRYLRP